MQTVLFFSRLGLYLLLITTPLWLTPAIVVSYDSINTIAWFIIVPVQMCLAYFLHPRKLNSKNVYLGPLLGLCLILFLSALFTNWDLDAIFLYCFLGIASFLITRFIFFSSNTSLWAILEIFFFAFVYFSFLNFTRSSPEISRDNPILSKLLIFIMILSFLFHAAIIYLSCFPNRSFRKKRNELFVFSCIVIPIFSLLALISPKDFVKHDAVFNEWNEEPPKPKPLERKGDGIGNKKKEKGNKNQNGLPLGDRDEKFPSELQGDSSNKNDPQDQSKEREQQKDKEKNKKGKTQKEEKQKREGQGDKSKSQQGKGQGDKSKSQQGQSQGDKNKSQQGKDKGGARIEGVPAEAWNNYRKSKQGSSNGKQNTIMIVASKVNPVYAAEEYWGNFRPNGLRASPVKIEPLNKLKSLHLLETWQDRWIPKDDKRKLFSVFFLSTIKERVIPYRPYKIQPTVRDVINHPFDLSYNVQTRMSIAQPDDWALLRDLNQKEKKKMKAYLEVPLPKEIKKSFRKYLQQAKKRLKKKQIKKKIKLSTEKYFERISAILEGFAGHQYQLGFGEDTSYKKIANFLVKDKKGDCTEFAHATALLARLENIPSRVAIGYLASRDLQTPAHTGALYHLQSKLEILQKYSLDDLYLVTTSHHHAWVQLWLPNFGWVDFETTSYSIPPSPEMDPNNKDVVIPLIEQERITPTYNFKIPYLIIGKIFLYALFIILVALYSYRWLRQTYYFFASKFDNAQKKHKYLQRRLLFFLARNAYPLKDPYRTTLEYSEKLPIITKFAENYTMLSFRLHYEEKEKEEKIAEIEKDFQGIIKTLRRKGFIAFLKRFYSLRELYY